MTKMLDTWTLDGIRDDIGFFKRRFVYGPGRRSLFAIHKKIEDTELSSGAGAERMRAMTERRKANWRELDKKRALALS